MSFHAKDGLHFERRIEMNGAVRIFKHENAKPGSRIVMDLVVDADTWCSIVAAMSPAGENGDTFRMAEDLHKYSLTDDPALKR